MAAVVRGDLVWVDLDDAEGHEQGGRRPMLVVSSSQFNAASRTVIAVAVTSAEPRLGFPFTLALPDGSLPRRSWAKLTQVRTLDASRLGRRAGTVGKDVADRAVQGLLAHLIDRK